MSIRYGESMVVNGRWSQIGLSFRINSHGDRLAVFMCDCGNRKAINVSDVKKGRTRSCGCLRDELSASRSKKHGHYSKQGVYYREYSIWSAMWQRCENGNADNYVNYGGRGINVCDRWKDFDAFISDMGGRPPGTEIDRKNNDGNYDPGNCRWVLKKQNLRNKRNSRTIKIDEIEKTVAEWAEQPDAAREATIRFRLRSGWHDREAVFGKTR